MEKDLCRKTVEDLGIAAGASIVGVAASDDFGLALEGRRPADNLEGCLSVIVLGAPFPQESLFKSSEEYTEIRHGMLKKMNCVAKEVTKAILSKGFKAKAMDGLSGKISLKHAAELAGIGIIGRNYLLINPEHGNLLWFSAVLTDAYITPDRKAQYTICDNCNKCVEICPAKALDNPASFGKKECNRVCWKLENNEWILNCFLCRKVCPYRFGIPLHR